ncbi:YhcN/YlaJ family sporulation lipoprotein [Massilibacterium senegalense]|uniref:YhcN/YlaJ family sporulation lipoprotein n=1 Tax=Massilibacterium senegalense TaxID=1632858 RepID=UPI00164D3DFC|nr:YhcN/YlaJ family sporulation lipoprotein [Massilibacterium senegalense]
MTEKQEGKIDQTMANEAKKKTETLGDFKEIEAVDLHGRLIVAIQLKQWDKWKRDSIEKRVKKRLKEEMKVDHLYVSSDYKIFIETKKLANHLERQSVSRNEAEEAFQAIVVLMSRK